MREVTVKCHIILFIPGGERGKNSGKADYEGSRGVQWRGGVKSGGNN